MLTTLDSWLLKKGTTRGQAYVTSPDVSQNLGNPSPLWPSLNQQLVGESAHEMPLEVPDLGPAAGARDGRL